MKLSPLTFFIIFLFPILLFFHFRGLVIQDEGYILNSSKNLLDGLTLYKDFHFPYTPLSVILTSSSYVFFGTSIFASRIFMTLLSILSILLLIKISNYITKRAMYGIIASLLYVAWGPTHTNFALPEMFVLPFLLLAITTVLISIDKQSRIIFPFLTGFFVFCVFASHQNYLVAGLPAIIFYLTLKKGLYPFLMSLSGLAWGIIALCIYLLYTDSFASFIITLTSFDINNSLSPTTTHINSLINYLLYIVIAGISIASICILIFRKKTHLLFIPFIVLFFSSTHILLPNTSDQNFSFISLLGIPLLILMNKYPTTNVKLVGYLIFVVFTIGGIYSALFNKYYKSDQPLIHYNTFLADRASIFTNKNFINEFKDLARTTNTYSSQTDYLYIDDNAPLLYFLLDRKHIPLNNFNTHSNKQDQQKHAIYTLVVRDIKIIFLKNKSGKSQLEKYVTANFNYLTRIGKYYIYTRSN